MSASPATSKQISNLDEIIASAVGRFRNEAKPDHDGYQRLFKRRGEAEDGLVALLTRLSAKLPNYTLARSILGGDFVTPEELATKRPDLACNPAQIAELAESIPSADVLNWCKANGYAVVAGSPRPMSLLEVRAAKADHFRSKTEGWYANANQAFSRNDKVLPGWLMIRKAPVPKSTNRNWDEQNKRLSNVEYVPNAAEMSWFITVFYEVRGVRLFEKVVVRTSSVDASGFRVDLGFFGARGLYVVNVWDGNRSDNLGVASGRKA